MNIDRKKVALLMWLAISPVWMMGMHNSLRSFGRDANSSKSANSLYSKNNNLSRENSGYYEDTYNPLHREHNSLTSNKSIEKNTNQESLYENNEADYNSVTESPHNEVSLNSGRELLFKSENKLPTTLSDIQTNYESWGMNSTEYLKQYTASQLLDFVRTAPNKFTEATPITRSAIISALCSKAADATGITWLYKSKEASDPTKVSLWQNIMRINSDVSKAITETLSAAGSKTVSSVTSALARIQANLIQAYNALRETHSSKNPDNISDNNWTFLNSDGQKQQPEVLPEDHPSWLDNISLNEGNNRVYSTSDRSGGSTNSRFSKKNDNSNTSEWSSYSDEVEKDDM